MSEAVTVIITYLIFSLPFAARVAWHAEWPCRSEGIWWNVIGGISLLLFGPFFWLTWARSNQP